MATAVCDSANRAAPDEFRGCAEIDALWDPAAAGPLSTNRFSKPEGSTHTGRQGRI